RMRLSFDTAGWYGSVLAESSSTRGRPSRLVLGVVPDVVPPPTLPPCPGLRAQPCRTYVPASNGGEDALARGGGTHGQLANRRRAHHPDRRDRGGGAVAIHPSGPAPPLRPPPPPAPSPPSLT